MSSEYRLGTGPLAESVPRVVRGRLSHAVELLRYGGDPATAVHEARKDMKKIRSILRLVRSSLDPELYRRDNHHFRDISRGLARFRDAEAMLECLVALESWAGEPNSFAGLRATLLEEAHAGRRNGTMRIAASHAADALDGSEARIGEWTLPAGQEESAQCLRSGIERTGRRGRNRIERVQRDPEDERWHDWRKRVKDLWYQQLLVGADPGLTERAHELSSLLGDDHDLAVLLEQVDAHAGVFSWSGEHRRLSDLIVRRRDGLQGRALEMGRPLYAEVEVAAGPRPSQASTSAAF